MPHIPYKTTYNGVALAYRIALAFFFFFLARLIFYWANQAHFQHLDFAGVFALCLGGLRFDTSALIYTNAPFLLMMLLPVRWRHRHGWQVVTDYLFLVPNILALFINLADTVYYPYTLRRSTTVVFSEFANEEASLAMTLISTYILWVIGSICLALLMIFLYRRVRVRYTVFADKRSLVYYPVHSLILICAAYLCVGGMRGGFEANVRPITLSNAAAYVERPEDCALVLNTPFCLIRTIGKPPLQKLQYFPTEEAATAVFSPIKQYRTGDTPCFGLARGRNVVVIIVESFAREFVGSLNQDVPGYKGYTPCFDSIACEGYLFGRSFANGRKSIDAMPSILASLPSLGQHFVLSHYSNDNIGSLASYLRERGYSSQFFHGAPNGSMGFDAFSHQCGYKQYFGKIEYAHNEDFDGYWSIWDEPFLQRINNELSKMPQPFVGTIFTLSSHHPFRVPKEYQGRFPQGKVPLIQCIGYTDYALGAFFRSASKESWFRQTLFVVVADHASQSALPRYQNPTGVHAVPILFYAPGLGLQGFDQTTVVQQTDILPTTLALLGYDKPFLAFGSNAFDQRDRHFAINNPSSGIYQMVEGDYVLEFDGQKAIGLYHYPSDPAQEYNLLRKRSEELKQMTQLTKSILQQYNARMIDNCLVVAP